MTVDVARRNGQEKGAFRERLKRKSADVAFSFPFQLVLLHLRNHLFLFGTWVFLALFVSGDLGGKFGVRYLFLAPEYLGRVDFLSFFLVGVGFGALVMSWNLTTYLLNAYRFSFLACLVRPFTKFALNNSIIPLVFFGFYLWQIVHFCLYYELRPAGEVFWNIAGFIVGFTTFVGFIAVYFHFTNKDIISYRKDDGEAPARSIAPGRDDQPIIEDIKSNRNQWRVETYLSETLRPRLVRSVAHYDEELLLKVFRQNHLNALAVQLVTLIVLLLLGALMDTPAYRIPAGASIFLLTSVIAGVTGALTFWFNRWIGIAVVVLLLLINSLTRNDLFRHTNKAYGLQYDHTPAEYLPDSLDQVLLQPTGIEADKAASTAILENWKNKISAAHDGAPGRKPKMVLFCVSGGGLKSAVWTMNVLQTVDSITGGSFLDHTVLMSGASGGVLGAAYYRELALRKLQGETIHLPDKRHIYDISKDLLNPVAFTIITNDLFMPWAEFNYQGQVYKKDRGYIFEKALNENTHSLMDKSIGDYRAPEQQALIPMLFITPSIINDGRRLIISSQPVRYMMAEPAATRMPSVFTPDAVDFGWFFEKQGATNLHFPTALRMNATYPYILPNVTLPSEPPMEVLDAGFRDNFGLKSATRFIQVYSDWIRENTSGAVIVIVRAFERSRDTGTTKKRGVLDNIFNPLGIAFKIMSLQDFEHDNSLGFLYDCIGEGFLHIVRFTYHPSERLKDSPISFYITERERQDIISAMQSPLAQQNLSKLLQLLGE